MAKRDPQIAAHLEWIGFVRPTGLVVSAPALVKAGVILNRHDSEGQRLLRESLANGAHPFQDGTKDGDPLLTDFRVFAEKVLGWGFSPKGFAGTAETPIPTELEVPVPESGDVLAPHFAVRSEPLRDSLPVMTTPGGGQEEDSSQWQLLVSICDPGKDFDRRISGGRGLEMSPHGQMERLLRQTHVTAGLLFNSETLRLVSAPRGESSGWVDFQVRDMVQTAGRPICSAMRALLSEFRLLSMPKEKRLAALLEDSRKFQNEVSERLAEQVLHALYELLRGFQAAHDASGGELLRHQLAEDPDEVYRGLLTVVLRLVYLLYTEERDMLPQDETFLDGYSPSALYERLRADAALYPDTMDQRYGAYAQLLALWRMVHDGAYAEGVSLAPRYGDLFHPDRYPFLEGRNQEPRQVIERINPPLVSDGTVFRVLEKLIVLDAERISYRALDVEHIGSVYETMMGFRLERATGRSVAIKAAKKHGAPATLDLEALLNQAPGSRANWIRDRTDRKLTPKVSKAVRETDTIDEMHAALASVIDRNATPDLVPPGHVVLQPSEERRRSGSHYTPRELTEPIVRKALEPIMLRLGNEAGGVPRPEQILDLRVCDPAMGSGAFLVEACRQIAEALVEAWRTYDTMPEIPPDEDETIFARRLVAQRCLYGVDRNPKAVDLSKLSLWLTTLAKEHPLTFLDHAMRHGDSLVGLSIRQLEAFHWKGSAKAFQAGFEALRSRAHLAQAAELRKLIREADETVSDWELRDLLSASREETAGVQILGDMVTAAFFEASTAKEREVIRRRYADDVLAGKQHQHRSWLEELRREDPPLVPFHWQIEFPEIFDRPNPGFDAIVGNPPFQGGRNITRTQGVAYAQWLRTLNPGSTGGADLVAHFFRRAFELVRCQGTVGFIATNTIAQGATRASGLFWICTNGGVVYSARRRVEWMGLAAVVVSIVHIVKGHYTESKHLDGIEVEQITAHLFHSGSHQSPARLAANKGQSFQGSITHGIGFTFDDYDRSGIASSLASMHQLIIDNPNNQEVIYPFIGGHEVNTSPTHLHKRHIINFGERSEAECKEHWPALFEIVELIVKPQRSNKDPNKYPRMVNEWWKYWNPRFELYKSIHSLERILAISQTSRTVAFAFLPSSMVYSHKLVVFPFDSYAAFATLQSRVHDTWARFLGSTMKDDAVYTPSDCFETFPFPENWNIRSDLEAVGKQYYEFRAALMVHNDEGLTKTYNRFNDPYEGAREVVELRRLHAAADRSVLDSYGWTEIPSDCEFLLDYAIDEETWSQRKRKPYRYRWPDDVRDEVLARLLELNAERAAEEARAGK